MKFFDLELWPSDPVLLLKLLQDGRDSGNQKGFCHLVQMCWAIGKCDKVIEEGQMSSWKRFTSALDMRLCT